MVRGLSVSMLGGGGHADVRLVTAIAKVIAIVIVVAVAVMAMGGEAAMTFGVNWGTQSSNPLPASIVVPLLKNNGVGRLKLFDSDAVVLNALAGSSIEVMLGIPNDQLKGLTNAAQAEVWVSNNVVRYMGSGGVNIKYVAVGNEPFLTSYNGSYVSLTLPALQNVQSALNKANYGSKVKATVPLNADVLQSSSTVPSGGSFRPEIATLMTQIVSFLSQNGCPFTFNVYPFISLYGDLNFPVEYAFFDGTYSITDGVRTYRNVFDASYDTLVTALTKAGFPNVGIIIGEIGWPTDGDINANEEWARRFNQGFLNHIASNVGTPLRPAATIPYYLFGLLDEDNKTIAPGNFERHWGIFRYNGQPKYQLSLATANGPASLVAAQNVQYLQKRWCVLNPNGDRSKLGDSITYACSNSDCTQLGYGCSCNQLLDANGNASYAFNQYFQVKSQAAGTCGFDGLGLVTEKDPSVNACPFQVGLAYNTPSSLSSDVSSMAKPLLYKSFSLLTFLALLVFFSLPLM